MRLKNALETNDVAGSHTILLHNSHFKDAVLCLNGLIGTIASYDPKLSDPLPAPLPLIKSDYSGSGRSEEFTKKELRADSLINFKWQE
jgi:hypothetical protein